MSISTTASCSTAFALSGSDSSFVGCVTGLRRMYWRFKRYGDEESTLAFVAAAAFDSLVTLTGDTDREPLDLETNMPSLARKRLPKICSLS